MKASAVAGAIALVVLASFISARADPIDLVLNPSPQAAGNTCQSYSLGLAMAFNSASPIKAGTARELRELERRIRSELVKSAGGGPIVRKDWAAAVQAVSGGKLTAVSQEFASLDESMRFVAQKTGIDHADLLPTELSAALVKTPVLLSFTRIGGSQYPDGHIVTVFGIALPQASMTDSARPKLLMVNSAVKYAGGVKNICAEEDLSDADRYRATAALTDDYEPKRFGPKPFLVTYVAKP